MLRRPAALALALPLLLGGLVAPATAADHDVVPRRAAAQVQLTSWSTYADFKAGSRSGLKLGRGVVTLRDARPRTVAGRAYEAGTWTSPWASPGFGATSLIPTWEASTPGRSMVRVEVRAKGPDGRTGSWDTMADWSRTNRPVKRTTYSGQPDDLGSVNVDTWTAASTITAWQVRVTLMRPKGSANAVALERVGAVASAGEKTPRPTSTPGPSVVGTVLDVPALSQMVHTGHYPQWGGGGEAWCSATSTAMVLGYYGISPAPTGIAPGHVDAVVDHTAKMVYDHGYRGTGNWAFNTAYAATLVAGDSYVTRMSGLREAEDYIAAGVPLVASIAFGRGQLTGAPIAASNGHLLVIVGFEADGDVVVNDPAGATNADVRRVYDRAEFERIWIAASGGTAYVIRNG
ncbi:Peptidase_C39 like family protein [Nocardioides exalbidus]|uniref:Peptidase_C39 like family protein n=1 Tax=Nocardioides exalbidus TaxID=402596 RepID=A0A1H4SB99_9ACTN|nr:peptidase C39 family protein [Nocardioides exalbidus]SEC41432.1 Peptidase_C39 like family protein [Nocardioides exalbidus]